jgi:endonuclease YncB( thermonuclease family)
MPVSRRIILAMSLAILLVLPVLGAEQFQFVGKVVGISDGDTLSVMREGTAVKVRIYGIDTPERAQAFGTRARQYTSELAFGQVVTVAVKDQDRYGRFVAEVALPDGRSLNQELLRAGLAWWYRHFAKRDTVLQQLEAEAREAK